MVEKFEVKKTHPIKGKCVFALIYQGYNGSEYASSFFIRLNNLGSAYELSSDFFTASNLYDAMLRAYCEGKKILQKNKFDCEIANEAFSLFQNKVQLQFHFGVNK